MATAHQMLAFARIRRAGVDWFGVAAYIGVAVAVSWAPWAVMHWLRLPLSIANALAMLGPAFGVLAVAGRAGIRRQVDEAFESLSFARALELLRAAHRLVAAPVG